MSVYYSHSDALKKYFIFHYDKEEDSGYVEKVDTCDVPKIQIFPIIEYVPSVGVSVYQMVDAIIAAWYSTKVSCEFNAQEFIEFSKQFTMPACINKSIGVVDCVAGLNTKGGYVVVSFDEEVSDIKERLHDNKFDEEVVLTMLSIWDTWHDKIKDVPSSESMYVHGEAEVSKYMNTAIYNFRR